MVSTILSPACRLRGWLARWENGPAVDTVTAMRKLEESGHYAIAGFLYQFIGSGVEAFEVYKAPPDDAEPREVLRVECFGQDAAVLSADGSDKKPKLIQFKYSSKAEGDPIAPSDLRKVLEAFLKSIRSQGMEIDHVAFELVTNRPYSPGSEKWVAAQSSGIGSKLEEFIRASSESEVADVAELASIFRNFRRKERTEAALREEIRKTGESFGMLDEEIAAGVHELVGLLVEKAGHAGLRIVRPEEIHKAFVGYDNPYSLLSEPSVRRRLEDVTAFKHWQTSGLPATIPRRVSAEIAQAVLEHPIVVVYGDGGCGKSVAVCDAVTSCLQNENPTPAFGLILPALDAKTEAIMDTIAAWRNLPQHRDGLDYRRSIGRLQRACPTEPFLVVCIDAIDEKEGRHCLSDSARRFMADLMHDAIRDHQTAVVLTCRSLGELDRLSLGGFEFPWPRHEIKVNDFDDDEIGQLVTTLDSSVRNRIAGQLKLPEWQTSQLPSRSARPIPTEVMEIIRHPVIWRFFAESDKRTQDACLDGVVGLDALGLKYYTWFQQKAGMRVSGLTRGECSEALRAVSQRFMDNSARVGEREGDWMSPCISAGCSRPNAGALLEEAVTTGMLIEEESGGRRWRWKHKWFCEYLLRVGTT